MSVKNFKDNCPLASRVEDGPPVAADRRRHEDHEPGVPRQRGAGVGEHRGDLRDDGDHEDGHDADDD